MEKSSIATPDVPVPSDGHGWTLLDGKLEPLWYKGHVLPQQLADIADSSMDSDEESGAELSEVDHAGGADDTSDEDW